MFHLCTTATFPAIHHKRKILDILLNIKDFRLVGVTRFELATTRPPDVYSNRAELHPDGVWCKPSVGKYLVVGRLLYLGLYSRSEQADNEFYRGRGYMNCNHVTVPSVGTK